jgi:hypothetical protein
VKDLAAGYTGALQRRNGQPVPGGIARASETQLDIRIGGGLAQINWADLTPQSVLSMARAFFRLSPAGVALADRQWQAGVFCIFTEQYTDSQQLMSDAATVKEEYRVHKARFFGEPEPEPAGTPTPAVPKVTEKKPDAAPSTGLEMAKDPLNPNKRNTAEDIIKSLRKPPQP